VFDKKYESKVDAFYIGDMLRSLGLAVTNGECEKRGQTPKAGTKSITVEEFLAIYAEFFKMPEKTFGTYEDFMEGLKLYDKESNGLLSLGELSQVLVGLAEKLPVDFVEDIIRSTDTKEDADGMINYDGNLIYFEHKQIYINQLNSFLFLFF
jgi:Ca2+-binding EF-hand superfamily protein